MRKAEIEQERAEVRKVLAMIERGELEGTDVQAAYMRGTVDALDWVIEPRDDESDIRAPLCVGGSLRRFLEVSETSSARPAVKSPHRRLKVEAEGWQLRVERLVHGVGSDAGFGVLGFVAGGPAVPGVHSMTRRLRVHPRRLCGQPTRAAHPGRSSVPQ